MSSVSSRLVKKGLLNLPGASHATKRLAEGLLLKDAQSYHCFFRPAGLHNHLSHHILAAYDLGATAGILQKIYDDEARIQRPILLDTKDKDIVIDPENWVQYLGNANAYNAFFNFFRAQIESSNSSTTVEAFVTSPSANVKGVNMLMRLMSGALHPFIQIGYGLEFGDDILVATGLAQAAVHEPLPIDLFNFEKPSDPIAKSKPESTTHQPSLGPSILEILRQIYDSPILDPILPYDPNALFSARLRALLSGERSAEIRRICSQFYIDESLGEAEFNSKAEEYIWACTLLTFATGKAGRKPRLDFFLMHLVTSSLFFKPYFNSLKNPTSKANILRAFLPAFIMIVLARGRPVIKPELLMAYTDIPRPPCSAQDTSPQPDKTSLGNPLDDADYNPWPALITSSIYAPDVHVAKTMRTLVYAAREYGDTSPLGVIGATKVGSSEETLPGASKLDGTIFVRAAGVMMDYMGWVTHGQPARGDWDRSALGWDDAWLNDD